jgi:hypothetical protein
VALPHAARRAALLGIGAVVLAFALTGGPLGWTAARSAIARHRATAVTDGVVVEHVVTEGGDGDVRVRWTDRAGAVHLQWFSVGGVGHFTGERPFPVAFDPGDPTPTGFPGDPGEHAEQEDRLVPLAGVGAAAIMGIAVWTARIRLFRRVAVRPGRTAVASVRSGSRGEYQLPVAGRTSWVEFTSGDPAGAWTRYQQVMWDPAFESLPKHFKAVVHGDVQRRRRVVVELPDGTHLAPAGRLRRSEPFSVTLGPYLRIGRRRWWRGAVIAGSCGLGLGAIASLPFAFTGIPIPVLTVAFAAFAVNGWALAGGRP